MFMTIPFYEELDFIREEAEYKLSTDVEKFIEQKLEELVQEFPFLKKINFKKDLEIGIFPLLNVFGEATEQAAVYFSVSDSFQEVVQETFPEYSI